MSCAKQWESDAGLYSATLPLFFEINSKQYNMPNKKEWYAIKDGNKWQNYGLCSDGLYHWEKDQSYAGYTAEEMIDMGAE